MLVRITKTPVGAIDGFDVETLKVGTVYDLPASVASLLIVDGFGVTEARGIGQEARDRPTARKKSAKREDG
jgi:hypothetical protein